MSSGLFFDNKKYISAKEASLLTSYSKDYIGQLCRADKVDCKQIGRIWYVSEESILNYKNFPTTFSSLKDQYIPVEKKTISQVPVFASGRTQQEKSVSVKTTTVVKIVNFVKSLISPKVFGAARMYASSNYSPLRVVGTVAIALMMLVGALTVKDGIVAFADTSSQLAEIMPRVVRTVLARTAGLPEYISNKISSAPMTAYDEMNSFTDFYSHKLAVVYNTVGQNIFATGNSSAEGIITFTKNPPLQIVRGINAVALGEKKIIDITAVSTKNIALAVHAQVFAFISDSLGGVSDVRQSTQTLSASVAFAVNRTTITPVDRVGVTVYEKVNSWFDRGIYAPIASIFNGKPAIVNTVYVAQQVTPQAPKTSPKVIAQNTTTKLVTTKVIEKVTERVVASDLSKDYLEQRLQEMNNNIMSKMSQLSTGTGGNITNVYNQIAQSQRIDQLSGVAITNSTFNNGSLSNVSVSATSLSSNTASLGSTTVSTLAVTGSATSTFANGIDISSGCFSVNGVCVGGSGSGSVGAGVAGQFGYYATDGTILTATSSLFVSTSTGYIGIGTTSPYRKFSVDGDAVVNGNFFSTLLNATTGVIDTFSSTVATITGLTVTNSTTTNATTTNAYITRLVADNATTTNLFAGNISANTIIASTSASFGTTTVTNLAVTNTSTSTIAGALSVTRGLNLNSGYVFGAGLTSCSGSADKLIWNSATGQFGCGLDAGSSGGLTGLGAEYSSFQTGSSQTFATSSDANIGLKITSSGNIHTFTPTWSGVLSVARGGTNISSPVAAGVLLGDYTGTGYMQLSTSSLGLMSATAISSGLQGQIPFYNANGTNLTATSSIFIAQNGRVGIGTTSPVASLDVGGSISQSFISNFTALANFSTNVNGIAGVQMSNINNSGTNADFRFLISDTGTTTGNYIAFAMPGIGNTNTLFGQTRSNIATIFTNQNGVGNGRILAIGTVNTNDVLFGTNNLERVRITSTGNVAIGTSTAFTRFAVFGDSFVAGTETSSAFIATSTTATSTLKATSVTNLAISNNSGLLKAAAGGYIVNALAGVDYQAAGTYITTLGSGYASTTNTAVTFSTSTLAFNGLTIGQTMTVTGGAITVTPTVTGTLNNAGLTNSTISGISLGSNLANLTATDSTLTFSGSYNGGTARTVGLNLSNPNTWTALQSFNYSSSTIYSSFATASTTNLIVNGQSFNNLLGGGLLNTGNALTLDTTFLNTIANSYIAASTTIPKTYTANTFTNTNTFNGTLTYGATAINSLLSTNASGQIVATSTPTFGFFNATSTTATSTIAGGLAIGTNKFVVDRSTGNVGVGTNSPTQKLQVSGGDIAMDNGAHINFGIGGSVRGGDVFISLQTNSADRIVANYGGSILFGNENNQVQMVILPSGDVGIGSTSPWGKLSVNNYSAGVNTTPLFVISSSTGALATSTQFIVTSTGNVGVGTSSPSARLSVSGDGYISNALGVGIVNTVGGTLRTSGTITSGGGLTLLGLLNCNASSQALQTDGSGIVSCGSITGGGASVGGGWTSISPNIVRLSTTTDLVGMGTTSPYAKLSINSGSTATTTLALVPVSGQVANILDIYNTTGGLQSVITASGKFGIGTSAPQYRLDVNGGARIVSDYNHLILQKSQYASSANQLKFLENDGTELGQIWSESATWPLGLTAGAGSTNVFAVNNVGTVNIGGTDAKYTPAISVLQSGKIGIGTTTPLAKLNVYGGDTVLQTTVNSLTAFNILNAATTSVFSVSTQGFGTTTLAGLSIIGQATSTSNVGINLTGGCFAVGGNCIGGSSFTNTLANGGTATTTFYNGGVVFSDSTKLTQSSSASNFFWDETNKRLGLGTSTPFAKLSVNSIAGEPSFVIGSSTGTSFIVDKSGNVGVGTVSPTQKLELGPAGGIKLNSLGGTYGVILKSTDSFLGLDGLAIRNQSDTAYASMASAGFFSAYSTVGNSGGFMNNDFSAYRTSVNVNDTGTIVTASTGQYGWSPLTGFGFLSQTNDTGLARLSAGAVKVTDGSTGSGNLFAGNIGVATTTLTYPLSAYSATTPQLALSAGAGLAQWTMRNAGGNLYFATTTVAGIATTSTSALTILNNGNVGVGTASPQQKLDVNGSITTNGSIYISDYAGSLMWGSSNTAGISGGSGPGGTTDYLAFSTAGASRIHINSSGNIGIGTTTPLAKLNVYGGDTVLQTTVNSLTAFNILNAATTSVFSVSTQGFGTTTLAGLNIVGSATSTSNVGINLTGGCFAVGGNCIGSGSVTSVTGTYPILSTGGVTPVLSLAFGTTTNNTWGGTNTFSNTLNLSSVAINSLLSTDASGNITATSTPTFGFFNATSTTATSTIAGGLAIGTNKFVVDRSTGNVGIGTGNPQGKLDVNGEIITNRKITTADVVMGDNNGICFAGSCNYSQIIGANSYLAMGTAGIERMRIDSSGNLGIGTTSPYRKLSVVGDGVFTGGNVLASTFTATSSITTPSLTLSSVAINSLLSTNASGQIVATSTPTFGFFNATSTTATSTIAGGLSVAGTSGLTVLQNGRVGVGTVNPGATLEVNGTAILGGGTQTSMPTGQAFFTGNVPNGDMSAMVLYNAGGGAGSAVSLDFYNTFSHSGIPQAKIKAVDDGSFSDDLVFLNKIPGASTNALAERMRLTSTGNLGIGTTSPYRTLSVVGSGVFTGGNVLASTFTATSSITTPSLTLSSVAINSLLSTDASGNITATSTPTFGFFNATSTTATSTIAGGLAIGTNKFVVDRSTGNVGIGTTSPSAALTVGNNNQFTVDASGNIIATGIRVGATYSFDNNGIYVGNFARGAINSGGQTPSGAYSWQISSGNSGVYNDGFINFNTSGSERMRIIANGNLGIGTTSPFAKLSVHANNGETNNTLFNISSSTASATTSILTVLNNGNVGIGTANPAYLLDVNGTINSSFLRTATVDTGNNGGLGVVFGGSTNYAQIATNNTTNLFFSTNGSERMRITTGGNIGIGTTTPLAKLNVYGGDTVLQTTVNSLSAFNILNAATTSVFSVSTQGFGTTTLAGLSIVGQATSTSNVGINLTGGCFAVGGNCIGGSSFTNTLANGGTATTTFYNGGVVFSDATKLTQSSSASNFFWDETNKRLGLGTSTPFAKLSVNSIAGEASFVVGSSTATSFIVDKNGNVGVGTVSPGSAFQLGTTGAIGNVRWVNNGSNSYLGIYDTGNTTYYGIFPTFPAPAGVTGLGGFYKGMGVGGTTVNGANPIFGVMNSGQNGFSGQSNASTYNSSFIVLDNQKVYTYNNTLDNGSGGATFAGNLGIGTTSPYRTLSVAGSGVFTGGNVLASTFTATSSITTPSLTLSSVAINSLLSTNASGQIVATSTPTFGFFNATSTTATSTIAGGLSVAGTSGLTVLQNGKVGVGTASPGATLEVNGTAILGGGTQTNMPTGQAFFTGNVPNGDMSAMVLYNAGGGAGSAVSLDFYNTFSHSGIPQAKIKAVDDGSFSDDLVFLNKIPGASTNALAERMRLTSTGNLGIGTTSPYRTLSVVGSGVFTGGNVLASTFTATSSITTPSLTLSSVAINSLLSTDASGNIIATSTPTFGFFNATSTTATSTIAGGLAIGTNKFVVDRSTGNVGVGTASPADKLDVAGRIQYNSTAIARAGVIGTLPVSTTGLFFGYDSGADRAFFGSGITNGSGTFTTRKPAVFDSSTFMFTRDGSTSDLQITSGGNVIAGSGIYAGSTKALTVAGDIRLTGAIYDANDSAGTLGMVLQSTGTGQQWVATSTLGITGGSGVSGGTNGYVARFTSPTAVSTGLLLDNGTVAGVNATSSSYTFNIQGSSAVNPFNVASSTGLSLFNISANGRVGIGTTSPNQILSVVGNINTTGSYMINNVTVLNATGTNNTLIGKEAGVGLTIGTNNFFAGFQSGFTNSSGVSNTFIGNYSGYYNNANYNTFLGYYSGNANTSGSANFFGGYASGQSNQGGSNNTFLGYLAGSASLSGADNVFVGHSAGQNNSAGASNVFVGKGAGLSNNNGGTNVYVGYNAGTNNGGSDNVLLGNSAGSNLTAGSRNIVIGSGLDALSATAVNTLNIGNFVYGTGLNGTGSTISNGFVGIGTSSPYATLSVAGWVVADYFNATSTTATSTIAGGLAIGTNKFVVDRSTGNVGIGTTSPSAALTVGNNNQFTVDASGNIIATGIRVGATYSFDNNGIYVGNFARGAINSGGQTPSGAYSWQISSGNSGVYNDGFINFNTSGSERMRIIANGNLGIGTTSPYRTLSVVGSGVFTGGNVLASTFTATSSITTPSLTLSSVAINSLLSTDASGNITATSTPTFGFFNATSTTATSTIAGGLAIGTNKFVVDRSTGNVGVGVANPTASLSVNRSMRITNGSANGDGLTFDNGTSVDIFSFTRQNTPDNGSLSISAYGGVGITGGRTSNSPAPGGYALYVAPGGNVGVGTTTPWAQLSVNPSGVTGPAFAVGSSTATSLIVTNGGNVGIGLTAPTAKLDVLGSVNITDNQVGANSLVINVPTGVGAGNFLSATANRGLDYAIRMENQNTGGSVSNKMRVGSSDFTMRLYQISGDNGRVEFTGESSAAIMSFMTSTGNLGLATTTPNQLLTLQGTATVKDLFNVASTTGASMVNVSWYGGFTQNISSTTAVNIQDGNNNPVFTIDTTQISSNAGIDITAGGSQTGNLLNMYSSGGTFLSGFTAAGGLLMNISSTTAIQIQNGSAINVFTVDTVNKRLVLATTTSPTLTNDGEFLIGDAGTAATNGRIWIKSNGTTFRFQSDNNTADYSEYFYTYATSSATVLGTIMTTDTSTSSPVAETGLAKPAQRPYDKNILGVVSGRGTSFNNPDDTRQNDTNFTNVGMLGHVFIRVSSTTEAIHAGDYLTSSAEVGLAMKATRSGMVVGQALQDYNPAVSTSTNMIIALVKPGFQIINNTFVLGEDDAQIATATSTSGTTSSTDPIQGGLGMANAGTFLINQKGSGNILQLQQNGQDRFLVNAEGSVSIIAGSASSTASVLAVRNTANVLFAVDGTGQATFTGHIVVSKNTSGTATIKSGDNQTTVTFDVPYVTVPKIVATMSSGLPDFFYGVTAKSPTSFVISTSKPVTADTTFDWVALVQNDNTTSTSSLNPNIVTNPSSNQTIVPPVADGGSAGTTPTDTTGSGTSSTTPAVGDTGTSTPVTTPTTVQPEPTPAPTTEPVVTTPVTTPAPEPVVTQEPAPTTP